MLSDCKGEFLGYYAIYGILFLTSIIKNSDGRDVEGEMSSTFVGNHGRIPARDGGLLFVRLSIHGRKQRTHSQAYQR